MPSIRDRLVDVPHPRRPVAAALVRAAPQVRRCAAASARVWCAWSQRYRRAPVRARLWSRMGFAVPLLINFLLKFGLDGSSSGPRKSKTCSDRGNWLCCATLVKVKTFY